MMPLTLAEADTPLIIKKIGGNEKVRLHLEKLGFTEGTPISLVNQMNGNVIVKVKDSRIAISKEMANKIMV